ncbi:M56 family metallopeptidase [Terriglobus aquaticus]|uniref:M56 family metallopeptidase n=1 Tax=Terriglobus aquaticus TaxID=940139 RepID=A0ABW9KH71_9BACT|nr:M56 family metallopeptidase [Terriglobus aquaticus]
MPSTLLHLSSFLTAVCVAGLWQGLTVALIAAAVLVLLRRAPAALRHSVLVAAFAGVLVLPWLELHRDLHAGSAHTGEHGLHLAPWIGLAVAALWLVGTTVRAAQLFLAWRHLGRVRNASTVVPLQGEENFTAGSRRALLCSSPDVDAPVILGFRSPRLLIPEWMLPTLSEAELHQIALHECEHLRRRDDWINLLLQVGLVLSPLNPALLWLNRTIRLQREMAVDAAVVARTDKPLAYAACLTRLAEQRQQRGALRLALSALGRKAELVQRVHALIAKPTAWTRKQSGLAFAGALALLCTAAGGFLRVPQLVQVGTDVAPASSNTTAADASFTPVISTTAASLPLVRTSAEVTTARNLRSIPVRIVPATFRSVDTHARNKHARSAKSSTATLLPAHTPGSLRAATVLAPRMMRTTYASSRNRTADMDAVADSSSQVQTTTAIFYTPYAAVPVANGWLLIEL